MHSSIPILFALLASVNGQGGGFFSTCLEYPSIALSGTVMSTACGPNWTYVTLDLNTCISNYYGKLVWGRNGNYGYSCWSCNLSENDDIEAEYLACTCSNGSGGSDYTYINLNEYVWNNNGQVGCL